MSSRDLAVQLFRQFVSESPEYRHAVRTELIGRNLACWCPLKDAEGNRVACHADILLHVANRS